MQIIEKNTAEWWEELNRLADLLRQWSADRQNQGLREQVQESMEKLGFITSR
jgi:hypothetical protein